MTVTERKRRRSPHQPVGRWIRPKKRLEIYWRDNWTCLICGRDLAGAPARDVTLDHLVPRSLNGKNSAFNIFTACRSCNSRRGSAPLLRPTFHRIAQHILTAVTWAIEGAEPPYTAAEIRYEPRLAS